jgi:CRISPR/Cas system-associated exonuclease Cas4 (RecB family)
MTTTEAVLKAERLFLAEGFSFDRHILESVQAEVEAYLLIAPPREQHTHLEYEFMLNVGIADRFGETVHMHGIIDAIVEKPDGEVHLIDYKRSARKPTVSGFPFQYQIPFYCLAASMILDKPVTRLDIVSFVKGIPTVIPVGVTLERQARLLEELQQAIFIRDGAREANLSLPSYHWGCNDCWYRDLCRLESEGETLDGAIEYGYQTRKEREMETDGD